MRAAAALDIPLMELYRPLISVQIAGFLFVYTAAYWLGKRQESQLGQSVKSSDPLNAIALKVGGDLPLSAESLRRPRLLLPNACLALAMIIVLISGLLAPIVVFMMGTVLAILLNYPGSLAQRQLLERHAPASMSMVSLLFAAGVFTGILKESGMLEAVSLASVNFLPTSLTTHLPAVLALISTPLNLLFDPDSFYFGMMPVLAGIAEQQGIAPVTVAHAAMLGQSTTGFAISPFTPATFLLIGLVGLELGEHQRYTFPWLFITSIVMTVVAIAIGVIPL